MYIEKINSPSDIKNLDIPQLDTLASEIRNGLMNRLSKRGGHFGPNFGSNFRFSPIEFECVSICNIKVVDKLGCLFKK